MNSNNIVWRISPGISQSGSKRGTCWLLNRVTIGPHGGETYASFGAYKTIKAAKDMIGHLKRKPIEIIRARQALPVGTAATRSD